MRLNKRASLLFLICLTAYLLLSLAVSFLLRRGGSYDLTFLLSAVAVSLPAFFVPALIFRRREGFARFKAPRFSHIMLCAAIGIGTVYLNQALSMLNGALLYNVDVESNSITAQTIAELNPLNMLLSLAIIPPISEEFLMRGTLLESWRRYSPWGAAVVTALLFALLHTAPSSLLVYFALGLLLAAVYLITRNVWLSVTVHFVNNFFSVAAALLLRFGAFAGLDGADAGEIAELMTGSPVSMLLASMLYAGLAAAFLVPLFFALRGIYRRNKLGAYSEEVYPEGSRIAVEPLYDPDTGEKLSMWSDPILWVTLGLLIVLNVISGLQEFGVIG